MISLFFIVFCQLLLFREEQATERDFCRGLTLLNPQIWLNPNLICGHHKIADIMVLCPYNLLFLCRVDIAYFTACYCRLN